MTDQHKAGKGTRKGPAEAPQGFDRERMILALIGVAGAVFILAMNFG